MLLGAMMLLLVVLLRFENGVAVVSCCALEAVRVVVEISGVWCEIRCSGELKL